MIRFHSHRDASDVAQQIAPPLYLGRRWRVNETAVTRLPEPAIGLVRRLPRGDVSEF